MKVDDAARYEDVLVAGTGAAGLTAALVCAAAGLRTLVCESSPWLGGTSAVSGGRIWAPANRFQPNPDADQKAAARYLADLFPRHEEMITAFLEAVPAMVRFVEERTVLRFAHCPAYPDYHPTRPGASLGGRCLDACPLALAGLDPLASRLRGGSPGSLPMTHGEWERWRVPSRYDWNLIRRRQAERVVVGGAALVGALLDGVARTGGRIVADCRLLDIRPSPAGGHQAVLATGEGKRVTVLAEAVVLATGGYDQDFSLREQYLPAAIAASASSPANVGDALGICTRLGARFENLGQGWWMPLVAVPVENADASPVYHALIRERGLPRLIMVDRSGRRFANEAAPYHELCKTMCQPDGTGAYPHARAYLVVDEGHRSRYGLPCAAPGEDTPAWIVSADNPVALAARLRIDPKGFTDQIDRWNDTCALGADEEFGKGSSVYDRYYGDFECPGNPNLGPLDEPPYYGIPVVAGTIGSKGGPVTNLDGAVLGPGNRPFPGIFAVGNVAAFWTADGYPGPGATLGFGMTFGYRAGCAIARATASAHAK